jgi:hypothetical protein
VRRREGGGGSRRRGKGRRLCRPLSGDASVPVVFKKRRISESHSPGVVKGRGYSWVDHMDAALALMVADDLGSSAGELPLSSSHHYTSGEEHQKETCAG